MGDEIVSDHLAMLAMGELPPRQSHHTRGIDEIEIQQSVDGRTARCQDYVAGIAAVRPRRRSEHHDGDEYQGTSERDAEGASAPSSTVHRRRRSGSSCTSPRRSGMARAPSRQEKRPG
jgi:hypothetical protein